MKGPSKVGEKINALRGSMTQAQFAELLGVGQTAVSAWEIGDSTPSPEGYIKLGLLAADPENLWFWEQAGIDRQAILSAADKIRGERKERSAPAKPSEVIRVPRIRMTEDGSDETGPWVVLPAEFIPNPDSTKCFVLDDKGASFPFKPGDIVAAETLRGKRQDLALSPFFEKSVLMKARSGGLVVGKLSFQKSPSALEPLTWYVRLESLNERLKTDALTVGHWTAEKEILTRNDPSARAGFVKVRPDRFAPEEIRLYESWEMVGLIVGWFRKPTAKEEKEIVTDEKTKAPEAAVDVKGPKKTAKICLGSKEVGEGKDRHFVPTIVEVSNESDLRPEWVAEGPVVRDGMNIYVTVDAHKMRFDPKTGALVHWK